MMNEGQQIKENTGDRRQETGGRRSAPAYAKASAGRSLEGGGVTLKVNYSPSP
jgi:hypothetical protein